VLALTFACFALGFGVKAAVMPLHGWVPDAHPAAPAPCSALLSGVLVAAGGFGLVRVSFEVFGPQLLRELGRDAGGWRRWRPARPWWSRRSRRCSRTT
jgi:multicomponent Na+:H+ antiporter subunit D